MPSQVLEEDPQWILPILTVRAAEATKEIIGTPGARPSESQSEFWAMLLETYYGTGGDDDDLDELSDPDVELS